MFSINDAETKEMLKGLEGCGIKVNADQLNEYLGKKVIEVDVSVRKKGLNIGMNLKKMAVGVSTLPDPLRDFINSQVKGGSISVLPPSMEQRIDKIERKLRGAKDRMALPGSKGRYISFDRFDEFLEACNEATVKMDEAKEDIVILWGRIIDEFKINLGNALDILSGDSASDYMDIISKLPTAQEFIENVGIEVEVRPFPVISEIADAPGLVSDYFKQTSQSEMMSMLQASVDEALNSAFNNASKILLAVAKDAPIPVRSLMKTKKMSEDLRKINVFENPIIESIATEYEKISESTSPDFLGSVAEHVMTRIWGYSKKVGISINLDGSGLNESQLNVLAGV